MYASVNDPKKVRDPIGQKKPPGFICEAAFCSITLMMMKMYSDAAYDALSFTTVLMPMMIYFICCMVFNILKFLKLLHTEDGDEDSILSTKQIKLLFTLTRNLLGYFGLYMVSGELEKHMVQKDLANTNWGPAFGAIQVAFLLQMVSNYQKRKAHAEAIGQEGSMGFLGATGLTTIFNALTQTTTTLCANGQCFTIYSNTISSNLAAFGCSVTSINTYLIPLCCCMLTYAIWNVYKTRRECTYKPFLLSVLGAALIIFDNFLFGQQLQLHNIPSWIGNALLIIGVLWSSKDSAKDQASPFDF